MQRALLPRGLAHRAVELELQDAGEEVARVRHVRRHMVLRAGIEVLLAAWNRRGDALIRRPQRPPRLVVIGGSRLAAEDVPAPLVDRLPERQESDLGESILHLHVDGRLLIDGNRRHEPQMLQIGWRHREHQGVADRLVEAVVRAALVEQRQPVIGVEVVIVSQLVMDGGEVHLGGRVADAHLDPQVVREGHVPGARVADDIAIARLGQHRSLPERLRERIETHGSEEGLARLHHPGRVPILRREPSVDVEVGHALVRLDQRIDVGPLLRPHVAEQVRGDGLAVGDLVLAIRFLQLGADVAVQIVVERFHLLPEPIGLPFELFGGHVVGGAPHVAHVRESRPARSLVLELHEALVALPLRTRGVVPGTPGIQQFVVIAAALDDLRQVLEVAPLRVLGGAVVALQAGRERRHLQPPRRIFDHGAGDAQQVEHAGGVRIERQVLELRRRLRGLAGVRQQALVGGSGVPLGVVRDVSILDPVRGGRLDHQPLEVLLHLRHELPRVGRRSLLHLRAAAPGRRLLRRGGRARRQRGGGDHERVFHGGAGYLNSVPKRQRSRALRHIR